MLAGAVSFPLIFAVFGTWKDPDFWLTTPSNKGPGLIGGILILGFITAMCILPALGVVVYYQRRKK